MISISQGINWYKVPVVGKHGKLNETIQVSALWSNMCTHRVQKDSKSCSWQIFPMFRLISCIKYSKIRCTHRVHRYQNVCTWQPNCAHQVQGAPLISNTVCISTVQEKHYNNNKRIPPPNWPSFWPKRLRKQFFLEWPQALGTV